MITRRSRRVLSVAASAGVLVLATAGPARAETPEEQVGTQYPSDLSFAETLGLFVGIPVLLFAVIAALVYATAGNREPRLREGQGQGWWAEPEYFSANDGAAAVKEAPAQGELPSGDDASGGSSARW